MPATSQNTPQRHARANQDQLKLSGIAGTPIPVRISAASLDTSRPADSAVMDWLAEHLRQAYKVPEATARELVKWRMVVPVLDGLDEMDAGEPGYSSRAGQVIRACNAYLDGTQKAEMILTCRIGQYQALEKAGEWVHNAARIQLCPVKVDTARSFLTSRVSDMTPWQPVLDQMEQRGSGPLAVALSTPWRLTLAVTAYGQRNPTTGDYPRNPADLATSPQLDTEDAVRDHLLALFIPATLVAHKGPYRDDHVHRWLAVLAGYLDGNTAGPDRPDRKIAGRTLSDTDLVLHELWPLAGSRAARAVTAGALAVLTAVGLAAFLLTRARLGFTGSRVLGAVVIGIAGLALLRYSWTAWPQIQVVDLRSLKTRQSRRDLMYTLARGPGSTIAAGTALVVVYTDEIGFLLAFGITFAFAIGLAMGLAVMLSTDFRHYSVVGTRQIIRTTYVAGIVAGLMMGLVGGLMMGLVAGLVTGLVAGLVAGLAGIRYIAFLLCTRRWSDHWLPWQLGGFLHWCYKAGLIRISGVSYQFRHRELQDYLASNPRPPRILSTPGSEVIPQP